MPIESVRKCLYAWWRPRSSKPLGRTLTVRSVGSIPMHFRLVPSSGFKALQSCLEGPVSSL